MKLVLSKKAKEMILISFILGIVYMVCIAIIAIGLLIYMKYQMPILKFMYPAILVTVISGFTILYGILNS